MTGVLFNFTNRCNIQCRHCYASCGPEGETMSMENIVKVLEHIPKDTETLSISGGEPFMERERMMQMLGYINENKKKILPKGEIALLTNGFWIRNTGTAYRILKEVYEQGIRNLDVTSNDKFHREQGINTKRHAGDIYIPLYKLMQKLSAEKGKRCNLIGGGMSISTDSHGKEFRAVVPIGANVAYPFGRGRNIKNHERRGFSQCNIRTYHGYMLTHDELAVAPDGKAYPCCWRVTPSIGSAIESPLEELVGNMAKSELFSALLEEGPAGAARALGVYREEDKEIYERNPCVKCEEIFRGIGTCVPGLPSRGSGGIR